MLSPGSARRNDDRKSTFQAAKDRDDPRPVVLLSLAFAFAWGLAGSCDAEERREVHDWLTRNLLRIPGLASPPQPTGSERE